MPIDGTAERPGAWPDLEFVLTTIAGRDNTVGMPIYLLPLDLERIPWKAPHEEHRVGLNVDVRIKREIPPAVW